MGPNEVIATLRAHEPELRAIGVVRLSLFGSTGRNEAGKASDVDLLAAFDHEQKLSLLDLVRIENWLSDLLGRPVDLIEEGTLIPEPTAGDSRGLPRHGPSLILLRRIKEGRHAGSA